MPMPTCQHTMSVTVSGPLTIGPTVSPSATSSHQRGSAPPGGPVGVRGLARRGARGALGGVLGLDGVDLLVGVGGQLDVVVLPALAGLGPLGADHQPVL